MVQCGKVSDCYSEGNNGENEANVIDYLEKTLYLSRQKLGQEYYYRSLVFCIIDAVYSINSVYTSTRNTVKRFCSANGLHMYRPYGSSSTEIENEYTVMDFLDFIEGKTPEYLAAPGI